jgi:hypothetical protein
MANTYNWKINRLDAKIHEDGLDNVIFIVHWTLFAQDDSTEPIRANSIGTLSVEYVQGEPFIPYDNLTKEDVVVWLESGLNVDDIKSRLDNEIELKKNPVNEYLRPDWD